MKKELKVLALASLLLPAFFVASSETATAQQPRRVIVIPRAPATNQVWVPGHHVRRGRDYIWVDGYYRSAPAPVRYSSAPARYKTWNPGYWRRTPNGRVWVQGYWSY
ncbi:hypothetical protein [Spirosoma daeguense]